MLRKVAELSSPIFFVLLFSWPLLAQVEGTPTGAVAEQSDSDRADLDAAGDAAADSGMGARDLVDPSSLDPSNVDPNAVGQPADGESNFFVQFFGNPLNLILISGILFIMLVLRPQQKQMKELQKQLTGLKKNDRVVTGSGIHGVVVQAAADEPVVTLRIDDNTGARMTVNRDAITKIISGDSKDTKD